MQDTNADWLAGRMGAVGRMGFYNFYKMTAGLTT